jgi:hypothetical protein
MTPEAIVAELDKHIVGQHAAKRAVAIALRNRWRRQQVAEPMRHEITPKNILRRPSSRSRQPSSPRSAMWAAMSTRSFVTWSRWR